MMITRLHAEVWSAADELGLSLSKQFRLSRPLSVEYLRAAKQFAAAHVHVGCRVHWESLSTRIIRMNRMVIGHNALLRLAVAAIAGLTAVSVLCAPRPSTGAADPVPAGPTRLLRFADVSKDKVVFAYA